MKEGRMKHVTMVTRQPAVAQSTKQTTKEVKMGFTADLIDRLALTARSLPWGVKFTDDGTD
jgi:hypothetical protein